MPTLPPFRAVAVASLAALLNVAFGYDVGVISGSLRDMATSLNLSTFEQELSTSGLNFVSGIGALLLSGNALDVYGRRATLRFAALLLLSGSIVVTAAPNFPLLLCGRALQGLGSGCGWCACSVYITECAPREFRGSLVSISDIAINVGILLGFAIDRAINLALIDIGPGRWRAAMAASAAIPLLFLGCSPLLPESPRWLLMMGREAEAARSLQLLLATPDGARSSAVAAALEEMRLGIRSSSATSPSWRDALHPADRCARLTGELTD
jgi:MFS family permease